MGGGEGGRARSRSSTSRGHEVQDDHLALNRAGIPAVDVIDFDYPHWHKLTDTAGQGLRRADGRGRKVITVWLQKIK